MKLRCHQRLRRRWPGGAGGRGGRGREHGIGIGYDGGTHAEGKKIGLTNACHPLRCIVRRNPDRAPLVRRLLAAGVSAAGAATGSRRARFIRSSEGLQ